MALSSSQAADIFHAKARVREESHVATGASPDSTKSGQRSFLARRARTPMS